MLRLGVLASGRGTNLQAILDAIDAGRCPARVVVVVSDRADAGALEQARRASIDAVHLEAQAGADRAAFDQAIAAVLAKHDVQLVCLAGYMRLLSPGFVRAFAGRILNVHPSLLPAFPGRDAQRQAWQHGVKLSGATVHLVDEGLDSGPILLQEAVPVREDDTAELLAERILEAEHRLYPRAVRRVLVAGYRLEGRRVVFEAAPA